MRRLAAAGFHLPFVRIAVLPDWWDSSCESDARLLPDLEARIARFVGAPLAVVQDPVAALSAPTYRSAQLRRVRDIDRDRLGPAIHAALRIAGAVVRNLHEQPLRLPPTDPCTWRDQIDREKPFLQLDDVVRDLWARGLPLIHAETLPAPAFQGLAGIIDGRPFIVIGHDIDEPGRLAFVVGHEVAHLVHNDCAAGQPVVDEDDIADASTIEKRADDYAMKLLTGAASIPSLEADDYKALARKASAMETERGIDASTIIWAWARATGDYPTATRASQALYRARGGKRVIRAHFDQNVESDNASESDRALLRCLHGDPERDADATD